MNASAPKPQLLIAPMLRGELALFTPQARQVEPVSLVEDGYEDFLIDGGHAFTIRSPEGRVIAHMGILHQWEGRALAWALLGPDLLRYMLPLTRAVRFYLDGCGYRRIEACIDIDHDQGHRWARLLGFECETPAPMKGFYPNGRPAYLYART